MTDPLRHHHAHRENGDMGAGVLGKLADKIAEGIGTVQFLVGALGAIAVWITINGGYGFFSGAFHAVLHGRPFDPAPWILLNLCFSFEAFFTGSLVVIAQKAQAKRDRAREEADSCHREELHQQVVELIDQNTTLTQQIHGLLASSKNAETRGR